MQFGIASFFGDGEGLKGACILADLSARLPPRVILERSRPTRFFTTFENDTWGGAAKDLAGMGAAPYIWLPLGEAVAARRLMRLLNAK